MTQCSLLLVWRTPFSWSVWKIHVFGSADLVEVHIVTGPFHVFFFLLKNRKSCMTALINSSICKTPRCRSTCFLWLNIRSISPNLASCMGEQFFFLNFYFLFYLFFLAEVFCVWTVVNSYLTGTEKVACSTPSCSHNSICPVGPGHCSRGDWPLFGQINCKLLWIKASEFHRNRLMHGKQGNTGKAVLWSSSGKDSWQREDRPKLGDQAAGGWRTQG